MEGRSRVLRRSCRPADRFHALGNEHGQKFVGMGVVYGERSDIAAQAIVKVLISGPFFIQQSPRRDNASGSLLEYDPFGGRPGLIGTFYPTPSTSILVVRTVSDKLLDLHARWWSQWFRGLLRRRQDGLRGCDGFAGRSGGRIARICRRENRRGWWSRLRRELLSVRQGKQKERGEKAAQRERAAGEDHWVHFAPLDRYGRLAVA
ncbi:hypothetical protein MAMT_02043 [Methylacidimicrobium tartarophylax]|uniref:Uncharacterized protein n=1 Tax=Methylacidimicrobium tartarophylax TaxID=1041768 RepID=A0A5E6MI39_9BACT|nr:hypothetical protein MAMT_02043 [Methylacidimicrobium tartarophylax]